VPDKAAKSDTCRLYVTSDLAVGARHVCTREQFHYLAHVMRCRAGGHVLVFNGRDGEWRAGIAEMDKRSALLVARGQVRPQVAGPDIDYLFAPLKRARLDYIVQKACELGAARIRPVLTRLTQVRRVNLERMRANAVEAAEQCGILHLPEIAEPVELGALISGWSGPRRLIFCDEAAAVASPLEALSRLAPGPVAVLVGPEGGFSAAERAELRDLAEATAISLGPRVMRADTAGVAALALVNAVLGDWRE